MISKAGCAVARSRVNLEVASSFEMVGSAFLCGRRPSRRRELFRKSAPG